MKVMALSKQMELFEDGGLKDEGGTVDPVSGNDVPPGSTQEEVRDDIPAQLSEGEFVMPADVVRFHGLDKMMQLRQEAKMGLKIMEEMGQMGNSEEATIPDDLPFNFEDLELDDEPREMQVGGYVAPQIQPLATQQSQFTNYTPQVNVPTQLPTTSYTAPTQQITPTAPAISTLPTFDQVVPPPGAPRKYINPETGAILMIPVDGNGNLMYPPPAGYILFSEYEASQPPATDPVAAPTTAPQQQQGRDDPSDEPSTFVRTDQFGRTMDDDASELQQTKEFVQLNKKIDPRGTLEKIKDDFLGLVGASTTSEEYQKAARKLAVSVSQYTTNPAEQRELLADIESKVGAISRTASGDPVSPVVGGYVRNPDGTVKRDASGQRMTSGDKPSNNLTSEQAAASEDINITTDPRDVTVKTATVTSDADATVSEVAKPKMPKSFGKDPMSGKELTLVDSAYTVLTGSNDPAERTRAINELATLAGNGYADATPEQVTFAKMTYSDLVSNKTLKEDEVRIGNSIRDLASDTSTTKKPSSTDLSASRPTGVKLGRGEDMPMSARIEASKQSAQSKLDAAKKANRKQYSRDIRSDKYDDTFAQLDKARRDDNIQRNSKPNRVGVNLSEKVGKEKAAKIDDRQGTATNVDKGGNIYYDNDHDWSKSTQTNINSGSSSKGKAIKEDRDEGGTGKIVCTEMYRQTQLDDWAKAMKIWDVYQRKYLTQYHEVGYHWLFKPYVKGMQSSNVLTKLGAFMATKRTKHLKHILTKGIAKDDIVGNIWCKIIHPIVYAAGKIKTWKK